ncbi:unnamed protein product [Mytilus coruscus]|uniref:Farnesoic acid O-methyl transferase domain-containing protein n=1 Tax=Mytilus coruscus TaxID=42192 RepID=A0A6J7ZX84_MYTCO|nr:unnamed protein product [Mytilus coruscus]
MQELLRIQNSVFRYCVVTGYTSIHSPLRAWDNCISKESKCLKMAVFVYTADCGQGKAPAFEKIIADRGSETLDPLFIFSLLSDAGVNSLHKPPNVVGAKDSKPPGINSERSPTVTILGARNALGTQMPPYLIFACSRMISSLIDDCTNGASGSESATDCNTLQLSTLNQGRKDAEITHNVYEYYTKLSFFGVSRVSGTSFRFQVKSCRAAVVLLSTASDLMSPDFYEIFYGGGGNSKTYLSRNYGSNEAAFNTPDLLDCDNMVSLWLSWENGKLQSGTGSILGQNRMMNWNDPSPLDIKGIGIMSAYGYNAEWIISSGDIQDDGRFCGSEGQSLTNTGVTLYDQSLLRCALTCITSNVCASFDYNSELRKCHIVDGKEFLANGNDTDSILFTKCWSI